MSVREGIFVHLRFDDALGHRPVTVEPRHLYLVVEVADIAHDGLVAHAVHVFEGDDIAVAGTGHEDVALRERLLDSLHLISLHGRLQGAYRVYLGHDYPCAVGTHARGTPLAHIAVTAHDDHLAGNHHVRSPLDAIGQRLAAAVQVVEFAFGYRIVHVDGRNHQLAPFLHLIEAVHPGRRLLRNALPLRRKTVPFRTVLGQTPAQRLHDNRLFMRGGFAVERRGIALGRESLMNQQRRIAAVIHDKMGTCTARKGQRHGRAPPILFEALPLPCEDGNAPLGDGRRGMVLRGEDVAATPAHIGTELDQRLNQHRGLYGHVERPHDTGTGQRLLWSILAPDGHQPRHLLLRYLYLSPAPTGQ
ncbi:putative uncharacterized protein PY07799 [Alistipes sp. CAG:157]|nr:putative uncharacterized protein PY07799 [Alistipes sp. CAG:157]